jgi:DGQHR domain-containing protein
MDKDTETFSVSLVTQGEHRFYTLSMPSKVLVETATVDTRADNPDVGFQRKLDKRRAEEIAHYIDEGLGTIPCSIVLSAQPEAELEYNRSRRSITFKRTPRSFLILDGQHRVYGFSKAKANLRVPVVIYNNLSKAMECRLFIDINTKQRPVPNELLLDIKKLAEVETDEESLQRDVFDKFSTNPESPLFGLMSSSEHARGKLSRVTFYAALKGIWGTFAESEAERAYSILAAYLHIWMEKLKKSACENQMTNPVLFKALVLLFPDVAQRVSDRRGSNFSTQTFREVLEPFLEKLKAPTLKRPGRSHIELYQTFQKALRRQFTIAGI